MRKKNREYSIAEKKVLAVLLDHVGAENAIRSQDIATMIGMDERVVRDTIKKLIEYKHIPIGSSTIAPCGYYIIIDNEERIRVYRSLYGRAISILRRARAYDQRRAEWVSTLIGQLELIKD